MFQNREPGNPNDITPTTAPIGPAITETELGAMGCIINDSSPLPVSDDTAKSTITPTVDIPKVAAELFGISMQAGIVHAFHQLFNPPSELPISGFQLSADRLTKTVAMLSDPSLQQRVSDFTGGALSLEFTAPSLAEAESQAMQDAVVRAAMHSKPQHFVDASDGITVAHNILRELVDGGAMYSWQQLAQDSIERSDASPQEKIVFKKYFTGLAWFLSELAANRSPMASLVDAEIQTINAQAAESPSIELSSSVSGLSALLELDSVDPRLAAQNRVLERISQQMIADFREIMPDLPHIDTPEDLIKYWKEKSHVPTKQEFAQFLLSVHEVANNLFEQDYLRAIEAQLIYMQRSELFYEFVYESENPKFAGSEPHKIAKSLWLLLQFDLIKDSPRVARSRMPAASVDGSDARNFGYRMDLSTSYTDWIRYPLVRACGDVIMDSFQAVVDFGKGLDIDLFASRIVDKVFHSSQLQDEEAIRRNDQYDVRLISFLFFLLKNTFATKFVSGKQDVVTELARVAATEENLHAKTTEVLTSFQTFSLRMNQLRPGTSSTTDVKPFVFGFGFNGDLFGAPRHSLHNENEIWFDFSEAIRRDPGCKTFSHFLIDFSGTLNQQWVEEIDLGDPKDYYQRYKQLIKRQVSLQLKWWKTIEEYKILYEGFLSQLELDDLPFDRLDKKLQDWISNLKNWYFLPITNPYTDFANKTKIKLADPLPNIEHGAQHLTREFLLSIRCRRNIISDYPALVPYLYLYFRREICEKLAESEQELRKNIDKIIKFADFNDANKQRIKDIITEIMDQFNPHPEIRAIWTEEEIRAKYQEFLDNFARKQEKARNDHDAERDTECKNLSKGISNPKLPPDKRVSLEARLEQERAKRFLPETLPATPGELSLEKYHDFKEFFFKNLGVGQCVEPSFARVLGHDKFFPIFISRTLGDITISDPLSVSPKQLTLGNRFPQSVIPPCDQRCQHHVTAHLLVGDLLRRQSVDRLNAQRSTHGIVTALPRIATPTFKRGSTLSEAPVAASSSRSEADSQSGSVVNTELRLYGRSASSSIVGLSNLLSFFDHQRHFKI